tara:strand:+ start:239 stop:427 length:189 start_codon:yes stop_codon:yes gene_type:complete
MKKNSKLEPIPKGSKLTEEQKQKLEKHKEHHSNRHLASMRMSMLKGSTFDEAHKKAQKSVGK